MYLFNFNHASIKEKIGSLSVILLTFLFCVILYSIYKLHDLKNDMKEVAYLDIPLSQIISQMEFIELEQHLQFEEYQLQKTKKTKNLKPHQQLIFQKKKLKKLLDKSIAILETSLNNATVVLDKKTHQQVLTKLMHYRVESDYYEQHLDLIYNQNNASKIDIAKIEHFSHSLEKKEKSLRVILNKLSSNDANSTERHEESFFIISSILGICALILGSYLTIYIVRIIANRIQNIQSQITSFNASLDNNTEEKYTHQHQQTKDELETLEFDVQTLMSRLTKEFSTREEIKKQLIQLATQDKLTGLLNRHKWDEQINAHIKLAQRGYPFGLILLDIDNFKAINDTYGHPVGDNLLRTLAKTLLHNVRDIDLIFRLGGEEFTIICPMKDSEYTAKIAENIRVTIENLNEHDIPNFTVSIGVANYQDNDNALTIFKRVDIALYQAKTQGRNQVSIGDGINKISKKAPSSC